MSIRFVWSLRTLTWAWVGPVCDVSREIRRMFSMLRTRSSSTQRLRVSLKGRPTLLMLMRTVTKQRTKYICTLLILFSNKKAQYCSFCYILTPTFTMIAFI